MISSSAENFISFYREQAARCRGMSIAYGMTQLLQQQSNNLEQPKPDRSHSAYLKG